MLHPPTMYLLTCRAARQANRAQAHTHPPGCRWPRPASCEDRDNSRPGTREPARRGCAPRATARWSPAMGDTARRRQRMCQRVGRLVWAEGGAGRGRAGLPCVHTGRRKERGVEGAGRPAGGRSVPKRILLQAASHQDGGGQVFFSNGNHRTTSLCVPQHASLRAMGGEGCYQRCCCE